MVRKILRWALFLVVMIPVSGCVFVVGDETVAYLRRNEERARSEAVAYFALVAGRIKFDPALFLGPTRVEAMADHDARSGSFTFEWRANPDLKDKINPALVYTIYISYLPYSIEYSYDYDNSYYYKKLE